MIKNFFSYFIFAFQNIKANWFHTFLSVLGIVIGVGAMGAMLSLIDGMEIFARQQVASSGLAGSIEVRSEYYDRSSGVSIKKDTIKHIIYTDYLELSEHFKDRILHSSIESRTNTLIKYDTTQLGVQLRYVSAFSEYEQSTAEGTLLTEDDVLDKKKVATVNYKFAVKLVGDSVKLLLGKDIEVNGSIYKVTGIEVENKMVNPSLFLPITFSTTEFQKEHEPTVKLFPAKLEKIDVLEKELKAWLDTKYLGGNKAFKIKTSKLFLDQISTGFLYFRIATGLFMSLSILIGGIGIMNVLLISVKERTKEIGIRKAVGAKKIDIKLLFFAESLTISILGSFIGTVFGVLFAKIALPIARIFVEEIPFSASFSLTSLAMISFIAIALGIIFGVYPAGRAARLNPVDCIRRD
ncbi:MAG: putative ABC transport system permease protein [Sphingobacteriales bacterium]|jgi:putative ABC transport system permease protein